MAEVAKLESFPPGLDKFPCLGLAYRAGNLGGTAPAILNAANEAVVARFLAEKIGFTDIPEILAAVLDDAQVKRNPTLDDVLKADGWARQAATHIMDGLENKRTLNPVKAGKPG